VKYLRTAATAIVEDAVQTVKEKIILYNVDGKKCRSQWPRDLRRRSTAARLLRSWVRIPPRAWMFVCCECCVLSGREVSATD